MIDVDVAIEALATLFQGAPEGAVFVTALGLNGAMRSTIGRDAGRIKDFLQRHDQLRRQGLYFCVGTLPPVSMAATKTTWVGSRGCTPTSTTRMIPTLIPGR